MAEKVIAKKCQHSFQISKSVGVVDHLFLKVCSCLLRKTHLPAFVIYSFLQLTKMALLCEKALQCHIECDVFLIIFSIGIQQLQT